VSPVAATPTPCGSLLDDLVAQRAESSGWPCIKATPFRPFLDQCGVSLPLWAVLPKLQAPAAACYLLGLASDSDWDQSESPYGVFRPIAQTL
jgi:hypothetical protein